MKATILNGYEARQTSFLYVFVVRKLCTNQTIKTLEQMTNRNVPVLKVFSCSVNVKTKDCARSRPFQRKIQRNCYIL